jgi:hypothetical protein
MAGSLLAQVSICLLSIASPNVFSVPGGVARDLPIVLLGVLWGVVLLVPGNASVYPQTLMLCLGDLSGI